MAFPEDVQTVTVPELTLLEDLSNGDRIPIWEAATNILKATTLATLREFIEIGETGTLDAVQQGGTVLYVVPIEKEGDDVIAIPALAGKTVRLLRDGFPLKPSVDGEPAPEYETLSAGGIRLLASTLIEGQRYELEAFELSNGVVPSATGEGSGFIIGEKNPVNTNINISVNDLRKVFQVRAGSTSRTITLPDVSICPANSFVVIECLVGNTKQHKIQTTGGQYIYIEEESRTFIWIGRAEVVMLYCTEEGWFPLWQKGKFILDMQPKASYKVKLNQFLCDGSLKLRADYPRAWEEIQSLGFALVDDATWNTASQVVETRTVERPYRGCFSTGDGSTTFRVPDLMNVALRGLKNDGGSDAGRHYNHPGGFQKHEVIAHDHDYKTSGGNNPDPIAAFKRSNVNDGITGAADIIQPYGGTETRMDNVGVLFVMDF